MALYEYRCKACGDFWQSSTYGLDGEPCPCGGGMVTRVYSFAFQRDMPPHFNPGMGKYVSSKRALEDDLKRQSEEATARTGVEHSFASADLRDRDIFPVTEEGLQSTYDRHDATSPIRRAIEKVK